PCGRARTGVGAAAGCGQDGRILGLIRYGQQRLRHHPARPPLTSAPIRGIQSAMKNEGLTHAEIAPRHAHKAANRRAASAKIMATKTIEKGLLIVHTGKGKGKSTAAFGMVMRCLGHGLRVGVVQFVKGRWETGERGLLERFPELVTIKTMGMGFTWE